MLTMTLPHRNLLPPKKQGSDHTPIKKREVYVIDSTEDSDKKVDSIEDSNKKVDDSKHEEMANPSIFSESSDDFSVSPLRKKVILPSARHRKRNPKYRSPINPLFHNNVTRGVRANRGVNERDGNFSSMNVPFNKCTYFLYVMFYNCTCRNNDQRLCCYGICEAA